MSYHFAGRYFDVLVDDTVIDTRVPAHFDPFEQDGVFDDGMIIDEDFLEQYRVSDVAARDDGAAG